MIPTRGPPLPARKARRISFQEGYSAGSWRCSPAWTTYVPLDHLRAGGPLKCGWTTWFTKYGGPTERKWSNRTQVVQAGRPRHDMRDAVPPCGTRRRGGAGTGGRRNRPRSARSAHDDRPADPTAPDLPTHPEATRAGRHQRPSRSTSSKPPLNNLPPVREHHAPVGALRHRARFPLSQYYRVREYHAPDEVDVQLVAVVSGSTAQL